MLWRSGHPNCITVNVQVSLTVKQKHERTIFFFLFIDHLLSNIIFIIITYNICFFSPIYRFIFVQIAHVYIGIVMGRIYFFSFLFKNSNVLFLSEYFFNLFVLIFQRRLSWLFVSMCMYDVCSIYLSTRMSTYAVDFGFFQILIREGGRIKMIGKLLAAIYV